MKKIWMFTLLGFMALSSFAQTRTNKDGSNYQFTVEKEIETTPVENQNMTGTCWSFSTLSFIESELMRKGWPQLNLSEMFIVRQTYIDKADKYVRMHGNLNFGQGGEFHDVIDMIGKYGVVPESVYPGLDYGTSKHIHGELEAVLKGIVDAVIKNENKKLTPVWKDAFKAVLDVYLGPMPTEFRVDGKTYTPKSYADKLGIKPDDFVELTSFTHHPFYQPFVLEIPDNWDSKQVYNVPLDDMQRIIDNALEKGYGVAWGSDVSDEGFSWRNALTIVPDKDWDDMSKAEKEDVFTNPVQQKKITQEMRQKAFDDWETTDDHGMHITGIAKDQNGTKYYIVKNSWGDNSCGGFLYASESYVLIRTTCFMVHKDALPKDIKKKLGID